MQSAIDVLKTMTAKDIIGGLLWAVSFVGLFLAFWIVTP